MLHLLQKEKILKLMFDHSDWKVKFRYKMLFKLQLFSFQNTNAVEISEGSQRLLPGTLSVSLVLLGFQYQCH